MLMNLMRCIISSSFRKRKILLAYELQMHFNYCELYYTISKTTHISKVVQSDDFGVKLNASSDSLDQLPQLSVRSHEKCKRTKPQILLEYMLKKILNINVRQCESKIKQFKTKYVT